MKGFKAYDIRGIYNQDFDKNDIYKVGYFLPKLLNTENILVGYDARKSSPEIFNFLSKGITDSGANVYEAGLATTPMIYYGTGKYGFEASVMITASHNPAEYNGLKISKKNALPVGYDTGLKELEEMVNKGEVNPVGNCGKIIKKDFKDDYLQFFQKYIKNVQDLSVAVDCSNGMSGLFIQDLLGSNQLYLNREIDGTFPNHEPNPLLAESRIQLENVVQYKDFDLGIIFDGDGDRVMFVDEKGQFVRPDLIISLIADYYIKRNYSKHILYDIRTSWSVKEYIEKIGGTCHMWKVGHAFAKVKMREINASCGGELAGHYYFKDFFFCDSGILACLIVLNVLQELKGNGIIFSEKINNLNNYFSSGEVNYQIEDKTDKMEELKNYFYKKENVKQFYDFDGYRLEFADWWFNVRPSNTEPYLRLVVEAKSKSLLENKLNVISNLINS